MKTRAKPAPTRTPWLPKPSGSGAFRRWLAHPGSLTQQLQGVCRSFSVSGVSQRWVHPQADEARLLGMRPHHRALLREVRLNCDGKPVVFAHSVLPRASLRGQWHSLGRLGTKPLGAVLFANPAVVRTPLTYRKLLPRHPLYRRAMALSQTRPDCLWARRSVFSLHGASILVTEIFLPGVLEYDNLG